METIASFIAGHNLAGLLVGAATFLIIGLFHPMVIKGEYYLGATFCKWFFAVLGVASCGASLMLDDITFSTLAGIVAFSSFWSIHEVAEQVERVRKGWFPRNPSRRGSRA